MFSSPRLHAWSALLLLGATLRAQTPPTSMNTTQRLIYPQTKQIDQVDRYHGTEVKDPYRWLEDADAPETANWVKEQNALTFSYLQSLPGREKLKNRMTELFNYERYAGMFKAGGRYFYFHNTGLQNQNVLFTMATLDATPKVLLDPNTLSADGTVALGEVSISEDGKLMAYSLSRSGSDWREYHVRNIDTGEDLADVLKWAKFTHASWSQDGKGFYYQRFDEPKASEVLSKMNSNAKLCYHRIGDPQSADKVVYERPDQPGWRFHAQPTEEGRYVIIYTSFAGTKNLISYIDLQASEPKVVDVVKTFEASYQGVGVEGSTLYVNTNLDAPRGRLVAIDLMQPDKAKWRELVPQQAETLEGADMAGGMFLLAYMKDAYSEARVHKTNGELVRKVTLPGIGSVGWSTDRQKDPEVFYTFTTFTSPGRVYRYDVKTDESRLMRQSKLNFDPDQYETHQVFYKSKDGTKVPMFLVHKKGLVKNGKNPTYLYGYGGFNISMQPAFSVANLAWMELGGVFAMANLRGGGEYGEEWHRAGTKLKKQNVFDDFIAAAEYLIANQYTSTPKLAIGGGSNGGLLVGAVLNQRPDLFGAALPAVGVMDMLRFHKFTIGYNWVDDYGSPDNPEEFKALRAYSPLHNIKMGTKYPATLVTTADHDDRVVPGHSFKYVSALQKAQEGPAPILIRIETKAGHGAGKPISKTIEEAADKWAFVAKALGMSL